MSLKRIMRTFTREDIEIRTIYRAQDGPNPNTKALRGAV